jgi:RNA recognition motif-containing protein
MSKTPAPPIPAKPSTPTSPPAQQQPVSSPTIKLFVGQIPKDWPLATIVDLFQAANVHVADAKLILNPETHIPQGCAFVMVNTLDDANAAIFHMHNKVQTAPAKWLQVRLASQKNNDSGRLFLSNIGMIVDEKFLYDLFVGYGTVVGTHVLRTSWGDSKGSGIVEFEGREQANAVMVALDNTVLLPGATANMRIEWARSSPREGGGGRDSPGRARGPDAGSSPRMASDSSPRSARMGGFVLQPQQPGLVLSPHGMAWSGLEHLHFFPPTPAGSDSAFSFDAVPVSPPGGGLAANRAAAGGRPPSFIPHSSSSSPAQDEQGAAAGFVAGAVPESNSPPMMYYYPAGAMPPMYNPLSPTGMYASGAAGPMSPSSAQPGYFVVSSPGFSPMMQQRAPPIPMSPSTRRRVTEGPPGANLFVSGFPRTFTDDDMFALFSPFGALLSWMVFFDKITRRSKCFGFVSFEAVDSAERARVGLNKSKVGGSTIFVTIKQKEPGDAGQDSPGLSMARRKVPLGPPSRFNLEEAD